MIRAELPQHDFEASGRFGVDSLRGVDVLIPTMCRVTREVIDSADRLKLIQQCGAGLEGVDAEAAAEKGIMVANVPSSISGNADSVAELGIYLMIGLSRDVRLMAHNLSHRRVGEPRGRALMGKTVGLVGLGGIGKALAKRLDAFGARRIAVRLRPSPFDIEQSGLEWVGGPGDLEELLRQSDYVALCLPLTPETQGLMNRGTFRRMKRDAFLINLSRGGLVDREALEEALASGTIAGAGLDVFWEEPPNPDDPIFRYNILATPHIGGSTDVSMGRIARMVSENIRRVERGEKPLHLRHPGNIPEEVKAWFKTG